MQTKTVEEAANGYANNSLRTYFDGDQNLKWLIGIMRSSRKDVAAIAKMVASMPDYGLPERRKELSEWLNSQSK